MYQLETTAVNKKDAGNTASIATSFGTKSKKANRQPLSL
jgi:hypothetical protein